MKFFSQVVISVLVIFLTGIITVTSRSPQPREKNIKSSDKQLPPEVFPEDDSNSTIPHHLHGELPPEIFPDDKALAQYHSDLTTKGNNKNNTKDAEYDDKSDKNYTNKTSKVASEIPDLLNTDYMNITIYNDTTEDPMNNDTEIVEGPNVINDNKTHDEDGSSTQTNCSLNETTGETNSTSKNKCVADAAIKNETSEENYSTEKNDSTTNSPLELTTEPETSTLSVTVEITTNLNNLTSTDEYKNLTDILEPNNAENDTTTTVEYNTTIPTTEKSSKDDNATVEVKSNRTDLVKNATKETVVTSNQTSNYSAKTELPSAKVETTTVNISENIIDHKSVSSAALAASQQHAEHAHGSTGKTSAFLQPTESAAILAGVFVGIALLGYLGLLVWRRILEKRYGNREMLVNEDDFYDTNDLRNFEL